MQSPDEVRAAYDTVAREYAAQFSDELAHKPLDRELLARLVDDVGGGLICDLGCGPGQTTAFLAAHGANVRGIDLSSGQVAQAHRLYPDITFEQGDMLALPVGDGAAAGLVAFYAIVHFTMEQLDRALREVHRALAPGGRLLLAFHTGTQDVHVDDFLGREVSLDFAFFQPASVVGALQAAGFEEVEVVEREPYPGVEHPSRRAYVFARKPAG